MAPLRHFAIHDSQSGALKVRGSYLFTRPDALSRDRTMTVEGDSPPMAILLIIMGMQ